MENIKNKKYLNNNKININDIDKLIQFILYIKLSILFNEVKINNIPEQKNY